MKKRITRDSLSQQRDLIAGSVRAALFAALITVGSYIVIPLPFSPVPIAMQSGFVLLAGVILSPRSAIASVATYLFLGALGLPLFAGGTGGLGHILGPTGGYLVGYLPAVALTSMLSGNSLGRYILAATVGTAVIYLCGVSRLGVTQGMSAAEAVSLGMIPFLLGDAIKIAAVSAVAETIRAAAPGVARES
ncbi:MAG: biotin transporter BioY [Alkalispirochaetaceae bacterium]